VDGDGEQRPDGPILLYDGDCAFCAASVRLVLRHERRRDLRFAPLGGQLGRAVRRQHPELAGVDSVLWFEPAAGGHPERVAVRTQAVLQVARYLGGLWRMLLLGRLLPRRVADAVYEVVARHRRRLVREGDVCLLPAQADRDRFLE
jgi:predicted DCC family thiol-disulfide oxidoreductase YuxK